MVALGIVGGLQGCSYLLTFLWNLRVARVASVDLYGELTFALTIMMILGLVLGLGQQQAVVKFFSGNSQTSRHGGLQYALRACLRTLSAALVLGVGGLIVVRWGELPQPMLDYLNSNGIPILMAACGLALAGIGAGLYQSQGLAWISVMISPFGVSLCLAVGYFFINMHENSGPAELIRVAQYGHLGPGLLVLLIVAIWLYRMPKTGVTTRNDNALFRFGLKSMQIGLVYMGITHMDRLMLGLLASSHELGTYAVAARFAGLMYLVVYLFPPLVGPTYAREGDPVSKKKVYEASTYLVTTVVLLLALMLLCGGEIIVPAVVGTEYSASVKILKLLAVSIFLVAATGNNGLLLQMGGGENIELRMSLLTFGLNVSLNFWLIPSLGGWGAAIATAISLLLSTVLKTVICYRRWGTIPTIFSHVRHLIGALAFCFAFYAIQSLTNMPDYVAIACGIAAYFATLSIQGLRSAVAVVMAQGRLA